MESLREIGRWIAENESLLSGIVALVVLAGLIVSPIGKRLRRTRLRTCQYCLTACKHPI